MNSNTVEFVIRMRDMMSSSLSRLGSASQSTFSRMAQHADRMNQRNRVLSLSFDQIQQQIRQAEQTIRTSTIPNQIAAARRELASLQRLANNHPGNIGSSSPSLGGSKGLIGGVALGTMAGGIALQAGSAFLGIVKDGIGAAISGSMAKEQAVTGLSTFLGKKGAEDAYSNIRKDAEISPYGTESLLGVNRALISAGLNAKDAREDTMNLANAIAAVGGGDAELSRMAANMQQIKTVGKATAMDIKQFGMVGINIYEMLSKSTGKSIDQVKEMDVSYDQLAKSMAMARSQGGIYAGALEAQGQTRVGRWNAVKDMTENALVDLGDAMSPIIIQFLDLGQKALSFVGPAIQKITPYINQISGGLSYVIDYLSNINNSSETWSVYLLTLFDYYQHVWSILKSVGANVWKIVGGVLEWANKSMLVQDAIQRMYGYMKGVWTIVGWLGDGLGWIWNNVLRPILDGLETAYRYIKKMTGGKVEIDINPNDNPNPKGPAPATTPSYSADLTRFSKTSAIASGDEIAKKNKASSKSTGDTISGGGPKTINITLGKFFDTIQFTTMNSTESAEKITDVVTEALARVLYNGAKMI